METILKYFPDLTPEQRERFAALYGLPEPNRDKMKIQRHM